MKTIEQKVQELQERLKAIEITKDEFEIWKSSKVTQALLLDAEHASMSTVLLNIACDTVDTAALDAIKAEAIRETLEQVLTWSPENLLG